MGAHASAVLSSVSPGSFDLVSLMRAEYLEIPGLSVNLAQAARLWNAPRERCLEAFELLTREGFLCRSGERFIRTSCVRRTA